MRIPITFNEDIARAVKACDVRKLSRLVDVGRAAGATYKDLFERASAATGIDEAEWDALMKECDEIDSGDPA